jgi:hypothetical protein
MIRTTAAVLALLLVIPALAEAQDPPREPVPGEQAVHRVTLGETLSHIALDYLGNARLWPEIFEANRNQIRDPHWIYPWMSLVIPGIDRPGIDRPATVAGVVVAGRDVPMEVGEGFFTLEERRRLAQRRAFVPMGMPEYTRERTVFYGREVREQVGPEVLIQPLSEVLAVPTFVFHAAGWLAMDETQVLRLGELTGFDQDQGLRFAKNTVHPFDEVQVRFDSGESPQVGDHFLVYRSTRSIRDLGRVMTPSGRIEIIRVEEGGAVGRVVAAYDRIQIGHMVARMRTFPLATGEHPSETDQVLEAQILAFQNQKELNLPGDFAFLDRGERDGLSVGDEMVGVVPRAGGWGDQVVGRFQVVGVRSGSATVRIVDTDAPGYVRPGLRLVLDRKMP